MRTTPLTVTLALLLLLSSSANRISEQCEREVKEGEEEKKEATTIACRCIGNEELLTPDGYNYENVTSLRIASCRYANLHFASFTEASRISEIAVQNISKRLIFEPFLPSRGMKSLRLTKIRRIPSIGHDTFARLRSIENLRIEDTLIGNFDERFTDIAIAEFSLINVTVERIGEVNFSAKGRTLHIEDTEFQNVTGSLNFAYFSSVEIVRSKFHLRKPGYVLIEGDFVSMEDCVFSNASVNVVAAGSIRINGTCADGKSSMRLSSNDISSVNNRLPTEIIYTKNGRESKQILNRNNTVCIAGDCKCPKSRCSGVQEFAFGSLLSLLTLLVRFL